MTFYIILWAIVLLVSGYCLYRAFQHRNDFFDTPIVVLPIVLSFVTSILMIKIMIIEKYRYDYNKGMHPAHFKVCQEKFPTSEFKQADCVSWMINKELLQDKNITIK